MKTLAANIPNETEAKFLARAKKYYREVAPKEELTPEDLILCQLGIGALMTTASGRFSVAFSIKNKRRTVTCDVVDGTTGEVFVGKARCHFSDAFHPEMGMLISLTRAISKFLGQ